MSHKVCLLCGGKRLKKEALAITVGGKNIYDLTKLSVGESIDFFNNLVLTESEEMIAKQIRKEIQDRLGFMKNVELLKRRR